MKVRTQSSRLKWRKHFVGRVAHARVNAFCISTERIKYWLLASELMTKICNSFTMCRNNNTRKILTCSCSLAQKIKPHQVKEAGKKWLVTIVIFMCYGSEVHFWSIIIERKRSDSTRSTHQIKLLFLDCCSEDQINQAELLVRRLHVCVSIRRISSFISNFRATNTFMCATEQNRLLSVTKWGS